MAILRASAVSIDLAPPAGGWMSGYAARVDPSSGMHDPIMASALLLDSGVEKLAIVSCDLIGLSPVTVAQIRDRIALGTGGAIPASSILIACTHTHSGPASMPFRGVLGHVDMSWLAAAARKISDMVAGLTRLLAPARFACGSTVVKGIGYNRQDDSRPVDEQLGVIALDAEDGTAIATLVNFATHAVVLGPENLLFSGDYPGEVARKIADTRGGIGLFLQGACGDVDPVVYRERGWGSGNFADAGAIGECLSAAAVASLEGVTWTNELAVRTASRVIDVPLDQPPPIEELEGLVAGFEVNRSKALAEPSNRADELAAEAMLDWASEVRYALGINAVPRTLPAELFVAALNDVRIVGIPFEVYSDIGLSIKAKLRPLEVLFTGYANGLCGYCPTRWAKDQGGYGPEDSSRWFSQLLTPIGYGADELIVHEATRLAKP